MLFSLVVSVTGMFYIVFSHVICIGQLAPMQCSVVRVVLFSVVSVSDRLSVCQQDNSRTTIDITMKFSGNHPRVKVEAKLENGYCRGHGW